MKIKTPTQESIWLSAHPEVLEGFSGQWVALIGKKIVAHNHDLQKLEESLVNFKEVPYIIFVEEEKLAAYGNYISL